MQNTAVSPQNRQTAQMQVVAAGMSTGSGLHDSLLLHTY